MKRTLIAVLATCLPALAIALPAPEAPPTLTAAQIVDRNVEARGGLDAWRKLETMSWIGHIATTNESVSDIRFVFQLKRPDKTRFEISVQNQPSARIYDGIRGWRVLPAAHNGRPQLEPYGPDDLRFARDAGGIAGPLVDYAAKNIAVSLEGEEPVEGHKAYRLAIQFPTGDRQHVWIDADSFLELKYDRETRNTMGRTDIVSVYYRDYKSVDGLKLPTTIESAIGGGKITDRMVIERITLNTPLDDRLFARPNFPERRRAAFGQSPFAQRRPTGALFPVAPPQATGGSAGNR